MHRLVSDNRLEITTRIGCRMNCVYCPQALFINRYQELFGDATTEMTVDTFQICLNKVPSQTLIVFSGMCEPWLNYNCIEMLRYAVKRGHPVSVFTTHMGVSMDDWQVIKSIEYESYVIHLPDAQLNSSIPITPEYLDILAESVSAKTSDGRNFVSFYSCHGDLHPDIADLIPVDANIHQEMLDRAGNVKNASLRQYLHTGDIMCLNSKYALNHNVLLPNGTVLLCCMDYGLEYILGNLLDQDWDELRMSKRRKTLRRGFFDSSIDSLCRTCIYGVPPTADPSMVN